MDGMEWGWGKEKTIRDHRAMAKVIWADQPAGAGFPMGALSRDEKGTPHYLWWGSIGTSCFLYGAMGGCI